MQSILVYIILSVAVVASAVLLYRRFTRPDECSRHEGCKDCPLTDSCNHDSKRKRHQH